MSPPSANQEPKVILKALVRESRALAKLKSYTDTTLNIHILQKLREVHAKLSVLQKKIRFSFSWDEIYCLI